MERYLILIYILIIILNYLEFLMAFAFNLAKPIHAEPSFLFLTGCDQFLYGAVGFEPKA